MTQGARQRPFHLVDNQGREFQQVDGSNGWRLVAKIVTPILAGMMIQLVLVGVWAGRMDQQLDEVVEDTMYQEDELQEHEERITDLEVEEAYQRGKREDPPAGQGPQVGDGDGS